jgi:small subunit ribosomal protein S6e
MKFNIAYPKEGTNVKVEVTSQVALNDLYDKKIGSEIVGDKLGEAFNGYVFKIKGGNDKQGFPMMQGVAKAERVRLLLGKRHTCYRPRRKGERKRRSVRGCFVGPDIAVLHVTVLAVGDKDIAGLTDKSIPNRLGPKRASKIRKLFDLGKMSSRDDTMNDPCTFVNEYARKIERNGKVRYKRPKIQRLVTEDRVRRKAKWLKIKKARIARKNAQLQSYKQKKSDKKAQ